MTGLTMEDVAVGDVAEITYPVTAETIREFVTASGDDNPIHSDAAFAATTRFGRVIAPGMLTGSFVSSVIGTRLPGPGTIYLSQSFRFMRPVYIGDRVTARVEVAERLRRAEPAAAPHHMREPARRATPRGRGLGAAVADADRVHGAEARAADSVRRTPAGDARGRDDVDLDDEQPRDGEPGAPA